MEFPVMMHDQKVGSCTIESVGLYWVISCKCCVRSEYVERLYAGERKLGVLEKEGDHLTLRKRISKSSCPELPPENGQFALHPVQMQQVQEKQPCREEPQPQQQIPWQGSAYGYPLQGYLQGDYIVFPYAPDKPCPCEPLLCFFEVKDGYWWLPKEHTVQDETM